MKRIYQLKIELKDSDPKIWRRIQVAGETVFSDLHDIIQLSMGWEGDHLYEFAIKNIKVYDFQDVLDDGTNPLERDSMEIFLDELVKKGKTTFTYVYDFGDHWEHVIRVEEILPEDKDTSCPVCLDGEGACPPEDCGGIWRYQDILRILTDKNHPEYDEINEWIGESFDPDLFDCEGTNVLLRNYAEQWEEISDEAGEIVERLEGGDLEHELYDMYDADEDDEYDALKKFSAPQDVFRDEYERSDMEVWIETELAEEKSIENDTYQRLRGSGLDDQRTRDLILQALSIEWFYDLKYGTDHLKDRYEHNLHHLPEAPQEFSSLKDALDVLNSCVRGVPFKAIEYVQNDPSGEATSAVLKALRNHSDHQYCWEDCILTPFWYALAAEGHLCEELIDPVIQLYEDNTNDSYWLNQQGQYLIGKLAEKYPDLTGRQVLEAMEKDVDKRSKPCIFYLFDAFYFCDSAHYKPRLLALLERDDLSWHDTLVATIADLQITEGLPVLERKLQKLRANPARDLQHRHSVVETEEAIQILKGELVLDQDTIKPLSLKREGSWKEKLKQKEHLFYEEEGYRDEFGLPDIFDQDLTETPKWPQFPFMKPYIKEERPGRNDPCHCGSGKKYKKCCMDND